MRRHDPPGTLGDDSGADDPDGRDGRDDRDAVDLADMTRAQAELRRF